MTLEDTYYLHKAGEFANCQQETDVLSVPYGDLTGIGSGGVWPCSYIDMVAFKWCIAACIIETSGLTLYDADGAVIDSGDYSLDTSTGYTIATFSSDPQTQTMTARGKGKKVGGIVLENPVDILEDILASAGFDIESGLDVTSWRTMRAVAAAQGYKAAGVLLSDRRLDEICAELLGSFLGHAWINHSGLLVLQFDLPHTTYNIQGYLAERDFDGEEHADEDEENLCNQAECYFAPTFIQVDRRFKEGANTSGNFLGHDDGASTKDAESQNRYGIQRPAQPFEFFWIYDRSVAQIVQGNIVSLYANPTPLLTCTERSYRNLHVEQGQFVVFSSEIMRDESGLPLKNQIGKVLTKRTGLAAVQVGFWIQDTGKYMSYPPPVLDGSLILDGSATLGGQRNRERLV